MTLMTYRLSNLVTTNGPLLGRFHRGHPVVGVLVLLLVVVLIVLGVVAIVTLFRNQRHATAMCGGSMPGGAMQPMGTIGTIGTMGPMGGGAPGVPAAQYDPVITELRLRYARGEIARDEYLQRAADLGYRPAPVDSAGYGTGAG
jgi:hypothetical protein